MVKRKILSSVYKSLKNFPVVGILGSRQVGKTTIAQEIRKNHKNAIYLDLELNSDLNKLQDPELYLNQHLEDLVIIDEIQRMPDLFPLLRALVDQNRVNGRFLILGSASPDLVKRASESLAGRIIYHELDPFCIEEIGYKNSLINNLWLKGGYPESFLAKDTKVSFQWREAFIRSHLERDIPQLGLRTPAIQLRRFLTMAAHSHGQIWNASKIAGSLGVSAPTVRHYLDILEYTFIIRRLQPYHINIKKRLVKSPKIFFKDTGLLHTLLDINTFDNLQAHPSAGNSWEGFIMEQIIRIIPVTWKPFFFRTNSGAEIDLLLLYGKSNPIAVEIKYSLSPKISKGFLNVFEDLSCKKGYIVYPGRESYPAGKNIYTLPVSELANIHP